MKKPFTILLGLTLLLLVGCHDSITGPQSSSEQFGWDIPSFPEGVPASATETIIHNNGNVLGDVFVWNDGYDVAIEVTLDSDDDFFYKRYVHFGASLDAIPRNNPGNPKRGHFEDKEYFEAPFSSSMSVELALTEDDVFEDDNGDEWVYIALFAEGNIDGEDEGLWIGDPDNRFHENKHGGGNWATYFLYKLTTTMTSECVDEGHVWVDGQLQENDPHDFYYVYLSDLDEGDNLYFGDSGFATVTSRDASSLTLEFETYHPLVDLVWTRHKVASTDLDDNNTNASGWEQTNKSALGDPATLDVEFGEDDTRLYLQANFEGDCDGSNDDVDEEA